jgi:arginine-tRNA-protein transferase
MESINGDKAELNLFYSSMNDTAESCGYCKVDGKKNKTAYKWGFSSSKMSADLYEKIMFIGWRRCGDYYYKNDLSKTCCKLYSMRLDVDKFKINKNQKKVMKNFRKYLIGEPLKNLPQENDIEMKDFIHIDPYDVDIHMIVKSFIDSEVFKIGLEKFNTNLNENNYKVFFNKNNKFGDYSSSLFIVLYQSLKNDEGFKTAFSTPKEFYTFMFGLFKHFIEGKDEKFTITLSDNTGHLNFFVKNKDEYKTFRENKLKNENQQNKSKKKKPEIKLKEGEKEFKLSYFNEIVTQPAIAESSLKHTYTITLEPNLNFTDEKFEVYKKYQRTIHNDKEKELTKERYQRSWGCSNLTSNSKTFDTTNPLHPKTFGTYDLVHRIDSKIVAVGILDILPTSISSVYLYYDPDYSFLNLGVYTAIREIEFLKHLRKELDESFKYYAMGFYCYTCQKMRYKGSYHPSEILCPVTLNFVDLDSILEKVKENKYQQLSNEPKSKELEISKLEIAQMMKNISLEYNGTPFDLLMFINNYIGKEHRKLLISIVENLIENLGKNNFSRFKLIGGG